MTKIKHHARGVDPRIVQLADQVGLLLFRRDGELWLDGDVQLTFRKWKRKGTFIDATDEDRVAMASKIIRNIIKARKRWGTPAERYEKVLVGLSETVPSYQRHTYTTYREQTLDQGWMIHLSYWSMSICLCGFKQVRVDGDSTIECLAKLAGIEGHAKPELITKD